jgi:hypothetical protein
VPANVRVAFSKNRSNQYVNTLKLLIKLESIWLLERLAMTSKGVRSLWITLDPFGQAAVLSEVTGS